MVKLVFRKWLLWVIACTLILAFLSVPRAFCQDRDVEGPDYHNQRGMEYLKKGFYDHAPKKQAEEMDRNYNFAVQEFKAAISRDSSYTEAHRNLARVYFVQKNFEGAAEEYKKVTDLSPGDLDAYVNLALALIELKRFDDAVQALETAKIQTFDPKVLTILNTYITKVRLHQAKEMR